MLNDNAEARIAASLRATVTASAPDTRLPTVRELAARYRASPVTVSRALRRLVVAGLVETRPGAGTFVADRAKTVALADPSWQTVALGAAPAGAEALEHLLATAPPDAINLASGYPHPALQALSALGASLARTARRPAAWQRGPVAGNEELRYWFARQLGVVTSEEVVICAGAQAALSVVLRALAAPGDPVLVESPTYLGALAAIRAHGLRPVPVPTDADGVRPDLLVAAFADTGSRVFYCQPLYANPHGAVLAGDRRAAVLDAARRAGAFVVEDDYARDLTINGPAPDPLISEDTDGHVIHVRSLSKALAPAMRVAAVAAHGPVIARLRATRMLEDLFVAEPLQTAAVELVNSPLWTRHLRALRGALRVRRDTMVVALAEHLPEASVTRVPAGGLHLWVRLPVGVDDVLLTAAAAAERVVVSPGRPWYAGDPEAPALRLTYGAEEPSLVAEGVTRLARAYHAVRR